MVTCAECHSPNPPGREFCQQCLGALVAATADGSLAAAPVTNEALTGPQGTTTQLDSRAIASNGASAIESMCPFHPSTRVEAACGTCGTFYCAGCLDRSHPGGAGDCPPCALVRTRRDRAKEIDRICREISVTVVLIALGFAALFFVSLVDGTEERFWVGAWVVLAVFVPFALMALVNWAVRRVWMAWLCSIPAGLLLLVLGGSFVVRAGESLLWAFAVVVPVEALRFLGKRLLLLRRLSEEAVASPSSIRAVAEPLQS